MTFFLSAVSYVAALALALLFNRGAHRKPSPRRQVSNQPASARTPARGITSTGTSGFSTRDAAALTHDSGAAHDGPAAS